MITQQELEARLWDAANSLRGPVDPSDFKAYIFPLLFFKRLSDTWDEEHARAVDEFGDALDDEIERDYHRFALPDGTHWNDLRKVAENVGAELQRMLQRIEEANPDTLANIFGNTAWADKESLPEKNLLDLIETFNGLDLSPDAVSHDLLGGAYEYLLKQFADESGKKAGEFFTPRGIVHLLTQILDPQPGESIYDPACGSGGMLVEAVNEVLARGASVQEISLHGQEVSLTTSSIARMNLFLRDIEDARIIRGNTLLDPKLLDESGHLMTFDVVLANPPFSLKKWGAKEWGSDPHGRNRLGVPPAGNGDMAWIEHMLSSMNSGHGRVGVVMPHGVLFRGGAEGKIREGLLKEDLLEAVIGLAPKLFYSTGIPATLLIFRASKPEERKGHVLFIDAQERFEKGKNQNALTDEDIDAIIEAYRTGEDPDGEGGVALRLVPLSEIEENGFDLNIGRYVSTHEEEVIDVATALTELREAQAALQVAQDALDERLREAGYA